MLTNVKHHVILRLNVVVIALSARIIGLFGKHLFKSTLKSIS